MADPKVSSPVQEDKETGIHHHTSITDDTDIATPNNAHNAAHPEDLAAEAAQAASAEHKMSLLEAIRTYPKAIGWSVLLSSTLIMEGYDLALLSNLYSSAVFQRKYGTFVEAQNKYVISAAWQSGLSNGARAGEIFGLVIAGWTADRYGYRVTTMGFLVLMIAFIFVLFFAPNVQILVLGEVLCGMFFLCPSRFLPSYRMCLVLTSCRNPLGCFPECHASIRFRGRSRRSEAIPHHLHQHVLGRSLFTLEREQITKYRN